MMTLNKSLSDHLITVSVLDQPNDYQPNFSKHKKILNRSNQDSCRTFLCATDVSLSCWSKLPAVIPPFNSIVFKLMRKSDHPISFRFIEAKNSVIYQVMSLIYSKSGLLGLIQKFFKNNDACIEIKSEKFSQKKISTQKIYPKC